MQNIIWNVSKDHKMMIILYSRIHYGCNLYNLCVLVSVVQLHCRYCAVSMFAYIFLECSLCIWHCFIQIYSSWITALQTLCWNVKCLDSSAYAGVCCNVWNMVSIVGRTCSDTVSTCCSENCIIIIIIIIIITAVAAADVFSDDVGSVTNFGHLLHFWQFDEIISGFELLTYKERKAYAVNKRLELPLCCIVVWIVMWSILSFSYNFKLLYSTLRIVVSNCNSDNTSQCVIVLQWWMKFNQYSVTFFLSVKLN